MVFEELENYRDLLREGLLKYTRKAFLMLPEMSSPDILDVGCGSGVPTLELVKLSGGQITAIDINQTALDRLMRKIKEAGLGSRIKIENHSMLHMDYPAESFHIIWAEGSIAMIGFEKGLNEWRKYIKTNGFLVVHDDLGNLEEKINLISQCGYNLVNHFILDEKIWWQEYYYLLSEKLKQIRAKDTFSAKIAQEIESDQREVDEFNPKRYCSVFFIMEKVGALPVSTLKIALQN